MFKNLDSPLFSGFYLCVTYRKHFASTKQGLSQDLEIGCPKLAIVKFNGVQMFRGDHNLLRFQP